MSWKVVSWLMGSMGGLEVRGCLESRASAQPTQDQQGKVPRESPSPVSCVCPLPRGRAGVWTPGPTNLALIREERSP